MGLGAQQIDKGVLRQYCSPTEKKHNKKMQHRKQRRRSKQDLENPPRYNRYDGGWCV